MSIGGEIALSGNKRKKKRKEKNCKTKNEKIIKDINKNQNKWKNQKTENEKKPTLDLADL